MLTSIADQTRWLGVSRHRRATDRRGGAGYDVVIIGADKWAQVVDPAWYGGSVDARDAAVARLPRVLVGPGTPFR